MESVRHTVEWQGNTYTIEPLKSVSRVTALSPTWAVFRRGEFIGTLPYRSNETTMEFESRCTSWLRDLLRDSPHDVSPKSRAGHHPAY
jgi:hypothetical protein